MSKAKKQLKEINLILSYLEGGDNYVVEINDIKDCRSNYAVKLNDGQRCTAVVFLNNDGVNFKWED